MNKGMSEMKEEKLLLMFYVRRLWHSTRDTVTSLVRVWPEVKLPDRRAGLQQLSARQFIRAAAAFIPFTDWLSTTV